MNKIKFMKTSKIASFIGLTLLISTAYSSSLFAASSTPAVDMKFTINSTKYISMGQEDQLEVAPYLQNDKTMVPLRAIIEAFGFDVSWSEIDNSILCVQGTKQVKLKINDKNAYIDGRQVRLEVAPKVINGRTLVPLRFISENFGATVRWDGATKSIYITKKGNIPGGAFLLYDSNADDSGLYYYDGYNLGTAELPKNNTYKQAYVFGGNILAWTTDSTKGNDNLLILKGNKLTVAREKFKPLKNFKFGETLIISGLNEATNKNELLKFDGQKVETIASDFLSDNAIEYNGKLFLSKYDSSRTYSLVSYDGNTFTQIAKDYIVTGFRILSDNKLYLTGTKTTGNYAYLSRYDFNTLYDVFIAGSDYDNELPFELSNLIVSKTGQIYTYDDDTLYEVSGMKLNEISFGLGGGKIVHVEISDIKWLDNRLVLNITDISDVLVRNSDNEWESDSDSYGIAEAAFKGLMIFDSTYSWSMIYRNIEVEKFEVKDGKIVAWGTDNNSDDILLVYDPSLPIYSSGYGTNMVGNPTIIKGISDFYISEGANGEVLINAEDTNKASDSTVDKLLVYKATGSGSSKVGSISNLVDNFSVEKIVKSGDSIIFTAEDTDTSKISLFKYSSEKLEKLRYDIYTDYWEVTADDTLYVILVDSNNKKELIKFINGKMTIISTTIDVDKFIKLKNNFYLVYGEDIDKNSPYYNNNVLYLYNSNSNKLTILKADFNLTDVISGN